MRSRADFLFSFVAWLGLLLVVGCGTGQSGSGGDLCEGVVCPPGFRCESGICVEDDPCLTVGCEEGQVCFDGECVDEGIDRDGDGFFVENDCDDSDPSVVPGVTVPCATACGDGTSTCLPSGEWTECSAPEPPCECERGEVRTEDCGRCGTQDRACDENGMWSAVPGPCTGQGECEADAEQDELCEQCGSRTRVCGEECEWLAWGDCVDGDEDCPAEAPNCESDGRCRA